MSNKRIHLSANQIYEKDFKNGMRGYNQKDVDEFLDLVIQDYETFAHKIEQLKEENEQLKRYSEQPRTRTTSSNQQVNYDVLKRLSNLEKAVFGQRTNSADM